VLVLIEADHSISGESVGDAHTGAVTHSRRLKRDVVPSRLLGVIALVLFEAAVADLMNGRGESGFCPKCVYL
jgi:hypothetical protein